MITFNDLKSQVYEIAQQRFGHLTEDIKQRLDVELVAIEANFDIIPDKV